VQNSSVFVLVDLDFSVQSADHSEFLAALCGDVDFGVDPTADIAVVNALLFMAVEAKTFSGLAFTLGERQDAHSD